MSETKTERKSNTPGSEQVTVRPGKTHIHAGAVYDGDANDKSARTFACRAAQARRLRAAGVVE